jgi:hypothetical protein
MCHLRQQTDQALGEAAEAARIIMDQIAKSDASYWCKTLPKLQITQNSAAFCGL